MKIIDKLYKLKETMPDLQIKELNNKVYVFNIQTVASSMLTNSYILDYLSKRNLFKGKFDLFNDLTKDIPSVSFIKIKEDEVLTYLFNGFSVLIHKNDIVALKQEHN